LDELYGDGAAQLIAVRAAQSPVGVPGDSGRGGRASTSDDDLLEYLGMIDDLAARNSGDERDVLFGLLGQ
jgi:hypothetical protein